VGTGVAVIAGVSVGTGVAVGAGVFVGAGVSVGFVVAVGFTDCASPQLRLIMLITIKPITSIRRWVSIFVLSSSPVLEPKQLTHPILIQIDFYTPPTFLQPFSYASRLNLRHKSVDPTNFNKIST
jgi:hypothetical protein